MKTPKVVLDIIHNAKLMPPRTSGTTGTLRWAHIEASPMRCEAVVCEGPLDGRLVVWRVLRLPEGWERRPSPIAGTLETVS